MREYLRKWYTYLPGKLPGNKGFDAVLVKYGPTGEIDDIVILESKFTSNGKASLSWLPQTKEHLGMWQMSKDWRDWNIVNLVASTNPSLRQTGLLLQTNYQKITPRINVLDVSGSSIVNDWNKITPPR